MSTPVRQTTSINKVAEFSPALNSILLANENKKRARSSITWGFLNLLLVLLLMLDLSCTCSLMVTYFQMVEYLLLFIFSLNIIYHITRYPFKVEKMRVAIKTESPRTPQQQQSSRLLNTVSTPIEHSPDYSFLRKTPSSFSSTPISMSASSWRSGSGIVYPVLSKSSSHEETQLSDNLLYPNTSHIHSISSEESLNQYLNSFEEYEKMNSTNKSIEQVPSKLNSFWNYPGAKHGNETSFLRRTQYQLSYLPVSSSNSPASNSDDKGSPQIQQKQNFEIWKQINVDMNTLTRWTANIRAWISKTILERIMREIDSINDVLEKNGLADVCIGRASLDCLRKTAQTPAIVQLVPTLPTLVPFLEVSLNQEYLVKRIKDLGKSGSMSDFNWNGGSNFKGKEWDDSLPTDSEIIMHLFVSYMDTQLIPLPNKPDDKPFTSENFIKFTEKAPTTSQSTMAIRQSSTKPPQYQVIVGEKTLEVPKGHNNLFHCILLFLYHVNQKEHGMLGHVNLGRSGINMLWIIQS